MPIYDKDRRFKMDGSQLGEILSAALHLNHASVYGRAPTVGECKKQTDALEKLTDLIEKREVK